MQKKVLIKVWGLLKVPEKVPKKSVFANKSAQKSTFGSSAPICNYTLTGFHDSNVVASSDEVEVFVNNYLGYVELPGERTHQCND